MLGLGYAQPMNWSSNQCDISAVGARFFVEEPQQISCLIEYVRVQVFSRSLDSTNSPYNDDRQNANSLDLTSLAGSYVIFWILRGYWQCLVVPSGHHCQLGGY